MTSDIRVLKMGVRCSIFKLLLFQMLVAWCAAKHVTIEPTVQTLGDVEADVQDSIKNLVHTGIYSHRHLDSSLVQVSHPVKVTHDGELLSHAVDHSHTHGHARARRDLHMREHELPHQLHYNLTVDGRPLRIDLRPSVTFITPAMVVERHTATERTRERPRQGATACHYTGSVRGQPKSSVALSACDGLTGLLRTEHGEYWIEPSNQLPIDDSSPRPHVIFKRSAVDKVAAYHRAKRSLDDRNNTILENKRLREIELKNRRLIKQAKRNRMSKEARDKRRREYLEERQRKLEAFRRNPIEYRRLQEKLRMEQRRNNYTNTSSRSNSRSSSRSSSIEGSNSAERRLRNRERMNENRMRRIRRRRQTNCATKQPPYQWKNKNDMMQETRRNRRDRMTRRQAARDGHRPRRSVSKPRHVEVLLVADQSMINFHNETCLQTYLLTIMNIVSSLYMDRSIGNYIKVVVVKIVLEETGSSDLEVSTNADETLASFCKWQHQLNPQDDDNPHHHDVAILVTRQDICSQHDTPCSTLGVAHVAGMCKPDRSCSVNEDNGIMLAHTITHELGHNFGLYHDTEKIGCHRRDGATLHIMTPVFEADTVEVAWSRCSKRDVTNFLDAGLGECLSDKPSQEEYPYPEVPAGVTFDAAEQCHLQFGPEAVVCVDPSTLCEMLWCSVNNTCKTMLRAAAPGTTCGQDMWCQNQTCVARRPTPTPVDGGWGEWSEWSECSRTCGAGVSVKTRDCNNPAPENNGAYCIGDRSQYKVCNTDPCPINEPSFREVQCAKYNNIYNNETIGDWVPYFDQDKPCELHCVPRNGNDVELVDRGFVIDGTPCRQSIGSRDMCIAGVCYKVGCDWIVNSELVEDACGTCGGDGSACKTVQGIYTKDTTKRNEFSLVAVIPAGSRNVKIQEKASPGNFISIRSARTKKMYLYGAQNEMLTEYFVAGSQAIYERDRDWEKVRIHGPIADDIKVYQRLRGGKIRNPGVTYQYTVDTSKRGQFTYRLTPWSDCNVTCGRGYASRSYDCYDGEQKVDISKCYHIEQPSHEALMQLCRMPPCPIPSPPPPTQPPPSYTQTTLTHLTYPSYQQPTHDQQASQTQSHHSQPQTPITHQSQPSFSQQPSHTQSTVTQSYPSHQNSHPSQSQRAVTQSYPSHQHSESIQQSHPSYQQSTQHQYQSQPSQSQPTETHQSHPYQSQRTVTQPYPTHQHSEVTQQSHPSQSQRTLTHQSYPSQSQRTVQSHPSQSQRTVQSHPSQSRPSQSEPSQSQRTAENQSHLSESQRTQTQQSRPSQSQPSQSRPSQSEPSQSQRTVAHQSQPSHSRPTETHQSHPSQPQRTAAHQSQPSQSQRTYQSNPSYSQLTVKPLSYPSHQQLHSRARTSQQRAAQTVAHFTSQVGRTHWWVYPWKPCSKPCHLPGKEATKHRNVYCVDRVSYKVVEDKECDRVSKPITTMKCAEVPAC